jgi:hypothetical protein
MIRRDFVKTSLAVAALAAGSERLSAAPDMSKLTTLLTA